MSYMAHRPEPEGGINWPAVSGILLFIFAALLILTLFVAIPLGPSATPGPSASPSPGSSASPAGSASPSASPSAAPSASPAASPSASPSPAPTPSPTGDPAASCTGTEDNQAFFRRAGQQLGFEVYCAVLPDGWRLTAGEFQGVGGGWLDVSYRGPNDARMRIREGDFCGDLPECVPDAPPVGPAMFGDLEGELRAGGGGYAIVVEQGPDLIYLAEFTGVDEATALALGQALLRVP